MICCGSEAYDHHSMTDKTGILVMHLAQKRTGGSQNAHIFKTRSSFIIIQNFFDYLNWMRDMDSDDKLLKFRLDRKEKLARFISIAIIVRMA